MRPHFKRYVDYVMDAPKSTKNSARSYRKLILNTLRHVYADALRDKAHSFVKESETLRNKIWVKDGTA